MFDCLVKMPIIRNGIQSVVSVVLVVESSWLYTRVYKGHFKLF